MRSSPQVAVEDLHRVIDELVDVDVDGLDGEVLAQLVVSTQRATARLAAVRARLLSGWDSCGVWASDGARTAAVRLGNDCGLSVESAGIELRRARKLASMPHTMAALAAGEISVDHVDLLGRANHRPRRACFAEFEQLLVEHCGRLRYADAEQMVAYWRQHVDADGADHDAETLVEQRRASAGRSYDGSVYTTATLDPVAGTILLTELARLERQLYHSEQATGVLQRTPTQRRADALVEMATRSASTPPGAQHPRPLYTVLVGYETFAARICQLDDNTVIAPGQLLAGFTRADIERIVFDGPSRVIDVSERRRFTGALRRAIQVRDRHCQHPSGCDVPAPRCDCDHIQPRSQRGPTSQDNGRLLCPTHNRHPDRRDPTGQPTIDEHHERPPPGQRG